jgi:hypothetical protein
MSGCRFEVPQFSAAARIATRCSQFRHNASRGSKGSMPSSLRTLSSIQVPGMVCIGPLPPLDDMARASPPLSIRITARIQCTGIADLRDASAMKAATDSPRDIPGERAARCRRIDCREGVGQKQDCQKDAGKTHRHSMKWVERPLGLWRAQRSFYRHLASAAVKKCRRAAVFYRQPSRVDSLRGT